uniref:NAC domain-containing protein n=1 Tax=Fagus sylvatica TaxID=28930 RepID=A0A2N9IUB6_FAGSY
MGRDSSTSLAPGFRFHPTDEELVRYYLKRKVAEKPFRFDPISVVDIYKSEPWDLPSKSKLKTRDLEWYFFSVLDKKYGNSSRTNRATEKGYWKTTGKDRPVRHNSRTVGMKKTLVFHSGRAPRGARTNWVMHEYRLVDEELEKSGLVLDAFVLCRIFQKSGTGPKNGEQYGAPFVEEEWEDDDVEVFVPGEAAAAAAADEVVVGDDAFVEQNDLDQYLETSVPSENAHPLNFYYGETSNHVEHSGEFIEGDQKPIIGTGETSEPQHDQFIFVPEQYGMDTKPVKDEYFVESSNNVNPAEVNYPLDELYMDATENPLLGDGLYLEANDLSNPVEADPAGFDMLDEYLTYFDADDDIMTFDPSEIMGTENSVFDQAPQKLESGGTDQVSTETLPLSEAQGNDDASSSKHKPEATIYESDDKHPFIKRASYNMLGSIPAPPALASEFPAKEAALRLHSAAQSSSSVHYTAGMIRIRNMTLTGNGMDWSLGKNDDVNLILSFVLPQGDMNSANSVPLAGSLTGKGSSVVSRCWCFFLFFWFLILSVSFKIGSYIYIK